jgi:hypothetical protein
MPLDADAIPLTCTVTFTRAREDYQKVFVADLFLNLNSVVMRATTLSRHVLELHLLSGFLNRNSALFFDVLFQESDDRVSLCLSSRARGFS